MFKALLPNQCMFHLYRMHQATIYGYTHAGLLTAKDFVTRKIAPKIKLH